jgi:hypothetical protein
MGESSTTSSRGRGAKPTRSLTRTDHLLLVGTVAVVAMGCAAGATGDQLEEARDRLRPTATNAEIVDFIETCLEEKAITAFTRTPDGGFTGANVTPFEIEAMRECKAAAVERFPMPPAPKSRAELQVFYELLVREAACLAVQGYPVEVPSLDTYTDSNGRWSPYADVPMTADWPVLNEECPQDPWSYET